MNTADLTNPIFTDETKAREYLEAQRWPEAVNCPRCGSLDGITKMQGKSHRPGLFNCNACRKPFSVTIGTVYERSHIPLHKWLLATHLMSSSKKGISTHQLHRLLGITYKSAWFMAHRIREAMKADGNEPMGGEGQTIEADETFIGRKAGREKKAGGYGHKNAVVSLAERGGSVRSFHVDKVGAKEIGEIVAKNIHRETVLMTDEAHHYETVGKQFADHQTVQHTRDEYVRGVAHTNTVEGFYSIFKKGMRGIYQHCDEKHLHRYLAEFDFRSSSISAAATAPSWACRT